MKKFIKEWKWKYIDQIIYLFGGAKVIQLMFMLFAFILSGVGYLITRDMPDLYSVVNRTYASIFWIALLYLSLFIYQMMIIPVYAFKEDSRIQFRFLPMFFRHFIMQLPFYIAKLKDYLNGVNNIHGLKQPIKLIEYDMKDRKNK